MNTLFCLFAGIFLCNAALLDVPLRHADIIVKAEVLATKPLDGLEEAESREQPFYATDLRIISVLKGRPSADRIVFQHRVQPRDFYKQPPEYMEFAPGRCYLLLAKATPESNVYRQVTHGGPQYWHNSQSPLAVLCADDRPVKEGASFQEAVWDALTALLKSPSTEDIRYAIDQLDPEYRMYQPPSETTFYGFSRSQIIDTLRPLFLGDNPQAAQAAIIKIAQDSPYIMHGHGGAERGIRWQPRVLVNEEEFHLMTLWEPGQFPNSGGKACLEALCQAANQAAGAEVRATAIRALGYVFDAAILPQISAWAADPEPLVREAAAILLNDYPGETADTLLTKLIEDPDPGVRMRAAMAAAFSQRTGLMAAVAGLLNDDSPEVQRRAAQVLPCFPFSEIRETLEQHRDHPEFGPEFINFLAAENSEPYLDTLIEHLARRNELKARVTTYQVHAKSWEILLHYLQRQDDETLQSPEMAPYLAALENLEIQDMHLVGKLNRFYRERGFEDREKRFAENFMNKLPPEAVKALGLTDANRPL